MDKIISVCPKCNVKGYLKLEHRNTLVALKCDNCNKWIKWVGKKEIPIYSRTLTYTSKGVNDSAVLEKQLREIISLHGVKKAEMLKILHKIYS